MVSARSKLSLGSQKLLTKRKQGKSKRLESKKCQAEKRESLHFDKSLF
jgi:hypothetical protein